MSTGNPETSRVIRSKDEARTTYDRISGWYDLLEGIWEKRYRDLGLGKLGAKEGEIVLEIGFGTGHGVLALAQSVGDSGRVYGVDLSSRMFSITQARIDEAGLSQRVDLRCGDAVQLPFDAGYFDAIFMSFTLELFDTPEILKVLHECQRVLHCGGRICVVSLSKAGRSTWMVRLYEWGHRKLPRFLDCRPIFVQRSLEEVGFRTLDASRTSMWALPVEIVLAGRL